MKKTTILFTLLLTISLCKANIKNGFELIELMKSEYHNSWYKHFTFSQKVKNYKADTLFSETIWHEAYSFPNKLIIKFDDFNSGKGVVFINDSLYLIHNNEVSKSQKRIHDLMVLGFDVYGTNSEIVFSKLKELGYDLSKMHETELDGKTAYCVGKNTPEEMLNCFYIDKENLYFIRNIKYDNNTVSETRFTEYKMMENKYVATKILFYRNNELYMSEEYFNIKFPKNLNQKIFDLGFFEQAMW